MKASRLRFIGGKLPLSFAAGWLLERQECDPGCTAGRHVDNCLKGILERCLPVVMERELSHGKQIGPVRKLPADTLGAFRVNAANVPHRRGDYRPTCQGISEHLGQMNCDPDCTPAIHDDLCLRGVLERLLPILVEQEKHLGAIPGRRPLPPEELRRLLVRAEVIHPASQAG